MTFLQIRISTIFDKKSGKLNETFLTWTSLTCNIVSRKSWYLFIDKSQVQNSGDFITSFFLTVKNKKFRKARPMVRTPTPQSPVLFCVFTLFLLFLFVFHRKNIVLLHLMNRYATSTSEYFLKGKGIKVDF